MSAKSVTEEVQETIEDNLSETTVVEEKKADDASAEAAKLAALRAKSQAKQQENKMASKIVAKKERSIAIGVVSTGHGGGKIGFQWWSMGYPTIALNTASVDLRHLQIPDSNKLLLEYGPGGASKDMEIGRAAAEHHRDAIRELIVDKLSDCSVFLLTSSLGGGSGAGSLETIIDIMNEIGKPIMVMAALPMTNEDALTKNNSLESLAMLSKMAQTGRIANLMIVDNAKIEGIFCDTPQNSFFEVANKAIVEPLDAFNTLTSMPSNSSAFDQMELSKTLLDSSGCCVYGEMQVSNYKEDTSLAEAVITNLDSNLLSDFDLKNSKYVGVIFAANKNVWSSISASSINYAMAMVNDKCSAPLGVFKGIYEVPIEEDIVKVYSIFSGLGLPASRVQALKKETDQLMASTKEKETTRSANLNLDLGREAAVSQVDKIRNKIQAKSSNFGKFVGSTVVDRRK